MTPEILIALGVGWIVLSCICGAFLGKCMAFGLGTNEPLSKPTVWKEERREVA